MVIALCYGLWERETNTISWAYQCSQHIDVQSEAYNGRRKLNSFLQDLLGLCGLPGIRWQLKSIYLMPQLMWSTLRYHWCRGGVNLKEKDQERISQVKDSIMSWLKGFKPSNMMLCLRCWQNLVLVLGLLLSSSFFVTGNPSNSCTVTLLS